MIRRALEEHGVEGWVTVAADGESAIQLIEDVDPAQCPALAIIDLSLPKRPGREVLQRIRNSTGCRDVPVVILTSSDAHQDRLEALRLGASQYIRKPSRLEEFLSLGAVFKAALGGPR